MSKEEIVVKAEKRLITGRKVGALRRSGQLPGVILRTSYRSFSHPDGFQGSDPYPVTCHIL